MGKCIVLRQSCQTWDPGTLVADLQLKLVLGLYYFLLFMIVIIFLEISHWSVSKGIVNTL